jgi:hypothetical protein
MVSRRRMVGGRAAFRNAGRRSRLASQPRDAGPTRRRASGRTALARRLLEECHDIYD